MEIARCEELMNVPIMGRVRTGNPSPGFEILITQLMEQSIGVVGDEIFAEGQPVVAEEIVDDMVSEGLLKAMDAAPGWYLLAEGLQPFKGLDASKDLHPKEFSSLDERKKEPELVGEKISVHELWKSGTSDLKIPEVVRAIPESHPKDLATSLQEKIPSEPATKVEEVDGFLDTLKKIIPNDRAEGFLLSDGPSPKPIFQEVVPSVKTEIPGTTEGVDMEGNLQKIQEALQKNEINIRSQSQTQLKIQLDPEHLGKVDLDLTMEQGRLTAKINVESEQVLKLFQENLVSLQQVLQRQNVQLERIHLDLIQNHTSDLTDLGHHSGSHHPHKRFNNGRNKPTRISERATASFFNPKLRQELNILA